MTIRAKFTVDDKVSTATTVSTGELDESGAEIFASGTSHMVSLVNANGDPLSGHVVVNTLDDDLAAQFTIGQDYWLDLTAVA